MPPYLREVPASACWNASKMSFCFSDGIPIPEGGTLVFEAAMTLDRVAVVAILGLVLVPFVHLSVYLFRTIHPLPVVLKPSAPSLPGSMLQVLLISLAVHTLLALGFILARYCLLRAEAARQTGALNG